MSSDEAFELVRGTGNIFHDLDLPNADLLQAKADLAARIIGLLDERKLSVRGAQALTGFAAADFSRIRSAKLQRFTLDRLIAILGKLDADLEVGLDIRKRQRAANAEAPRPRDAPSAAE